jgi:hypothetical protein
MKKWVGIGLLTCCALSAGCDADRISKLEKENAELKAKVEKQNIALQYDLEAKCIERCARVFQWKLEP